MRRGGSRIERIYFNQFSVRGGNWFTQGEIDWKRQGPAQFPNLTDDQIGQFPIGYWDIESKRWVIEEWLQKYWPGDSYQDFMNASIQRRTFAPMLPPKEVLTRDGLIMESGLEVMFVGGKINHRNHWKTDQLLGRKMIVWNRHCEWYYSVNGKFVTYGDGYVKVREFASHSSPKSYWVVPCPGDDDFLIPGRNIDTTQAALLIADPSISLVTIDGRRLNPYTPKLPTVEPVMSI